MRSLPELGRCCTLAIDAMWARLFNIAVFALGLVREGAEAFYD